MMACPRIGDSIQGGERWLATVMGEPNRRREWGGKASREVEGEQEQASDRIMVLAYSLQVVRLISSRQSK